MSQEIVNKGGVSVEKGLHEKYNTLLKLSLSILVMLQMNGSIMMMRINSKVTIAASKHVLLCVDAELY